MRRAELFTALFFTLFSGYLMWKSGEPPAWNPDVPHFANIGFDNTGAPAGGFWPFWLSAIMLACSVWTAIRCQLRKTPASQSDEPFLTEESWILIAKVSSALIAFLGLVSIIGFYGAIFFFLIYYVKFLGKHGWLVTLVLAIVVPTLFFFFFDIAMRVVLPKGYSEPLFIPLYEMFL